MLNWAHGSSAALWRFQLLISRAVGLAIPPELLEIVPKCREN
jgi:hypothetical protein